MRFGLIPPVGTGATADPAWMSAFARTAERAGFESLVVVEHSVVVSGYASRYPYGRSGRMPLPDDCAIPDPLELLAFVAAVTETIGLATGVLVLPNHHPVVLAKRAATLDRLSGGRLRLFVGLGWMDEELRACGVDPATRGRRADEALDVLRLLWSKEGPAGVDFDGEFFSFAGARSHPKPAQVGGIPVHVGGHSAAAARRAGRRGDGFWPLGVQGSLLEVRLGQAREEAERAGRDASAIELTLGAHLPALTDEVVAQAEAAGATRMVLTTSHSSDLPRVTDELEAFGDRFGLSDRP